MQHQQRWTHNARPLRSGTWFTLALVAISALPALEAGAVPRYSARYEQNCMLCHVNPTGGGMRSSYATHPFREYFNRGLNVVLNTDNRLMSGVTLTDEYHHAARSLDFTFDELSRVALNGFESCFLPHEERQILLANAEAEIEMLREELP